MDINALVLKAAGGLNMFEMEYVKQCLAQYVAETQKNEMEREQRGEQSVSGRLAFRFDCQRKMICDISRYANTQESFEKMRDEFEKMIREIEKPTMDRLLDEFPIVEITKEQLEVLRQQLKSKLED